MKRFLMITIPFLLTLTLFAGCSKPQTEPTTDTMPSSFATEQKTAPATTSAPVETEADTEYEGDTASYYIDAVYAQQIAWYYTAIPRQWDENAYWDHEISSLAA